MVAVEDVVMIMMTVIAEIMEPLIKAAIRRRIMAEAEEMNRRCHGNLNDMVDETETIEATVEIGRKEIAEMTVVVTEVIDIIVGEAGQEIEMIETKTESIKGDEIDMVIANLKLLVILKPAASCETPNLKVAATLDDFGSTHLQKMKKTKKL